MTINTHGVRITYGKHFNEETGVGELFTRIPIGYLRWMINTRAPMWKIAEAEFKRRGDTMPLIELSGHAIDNASIRCRKIWHETKLNDQEGLYSWLQRVSLEALEKGQKNGDKIRYMGMKFVFAHGEEFPVLKTIMR